jgi:hypothetical protein
MIKDVPKVMTCESIVPKKMILDLLINLELIIFFINWDMLPNDNF